MTCDARRSSILIDLDGSVLGEAGTVVAKTEDGFDHDLLPHTFRYDNRGNTIPTKTLYQGAGAFRSDRCTWSKAWTAYECPGGRPRQLIFESMDDNWLER